MRRFYYYLLSIAFENFYEKARKIGLQSVIVITFIISLYCKKNNQNTLLTSEKFKIITNTLPDKCRNPESLKK